VILDPITLKNILLILTGFATAFISALWLSLIIWTYRDIRRRVRDRMVRVLAVLVVAILFLPGLLIYVILRPSNTLENEYQQTLEEEALLQSIEDNSVCPGCNRQIKEDWVACPNCHTKLKKPCHQCGKLMELAWNLCPYCGTPGPGMRRDNMSMDEALSSLPLDSTQ
jgi:RNA polymerase subunit RPABC4/transcription elongation factor Spt4